MKKTFLKFWKSYFNFTKGERNAFFALVALILLVSIYPLMDIDAFRDHKTDFTKLIALAERAGQDSSENEIIESFQEYPEKNTSFSPRKFRFNPNTATVREFELLGFRSYIAKRIEKYRASGGKFRTRADLNKVYGIDQDLVKTLWNDIDLPETLEKPVQDERFQSNRPVKAKQLIDINTADTTQLISLPGIGGKLAKRIVEFRSKLGGFYSLDQLQEVYGLKPETITMMLPQLTLDLSAVRPLEINKADFRTLDEHPYIDRNQANAIIQYRKQHGDYQTVEDLMKVVALNELTLNKIKNYIKF